MAVSALPSTPTETFTCRKCGKDKPADEFLVRMLRGKPYRNKRCVECLREANRAVYARNPEPYIRRAVERNRTQRTPETPEVAERRRQRQRQKYAKNRDAGRKYQRDRYHAKRRREQLKLTADLPVEVVRPYIMKLMETRTQADLSAATGISERGLNRIRNREQRAVSLETADKLTTWADFTLEELADRAEEWAILTGDSWPEGYGGRVAPLRHSL